MAPFGSTSATRWSHQVLGDLDVPTGIDITTPNAARMYDYYLGGANHFPADRQAAEHVLRAAPWIRATAIKNRAFLGRVVRFLATEGDIRQFIDIGTGLPTKGSVHDIVSHVAPGARVAYVDNDPVVLGQSRAILSGAGGVTTIRADLRQPAGIIGHPDLADLIDWSQPVAVLLVAVVHFIPDLDDPLAIIGQYRDAMAPGSYLAITHVHHRVASDATREVATVYSRASAPLVFRTRDQITRLFAGFELVDPGVVSIPEWRPEPCPYPPGEVWGPAGVGRLGDRPNRL
jgi:S-adenosyl methyltransferase